MKAGYSIHDIDKLVGKMVTVVDKNLWAKGKLYYTEKEGYHVVNEYGFTIYVFDLSNPEVEIYID